jgi:hypothetical protein
MVKDLFTLNFKNIKVFTYLSKARAGALSKPIVYTSRLVLPLADVPQRLHRFTAQMDCSISCSPAQFLPDNIAAKS